MGLQRRPVLPATPGACCCPCIGTGRLHRCQAGGLQAELPHDCTHSYGTGRALQGPCWPRLRPQSTAPGMHLLSGCQIVSEVPPAWCQCEVELLAVDLLKLISNATCAWPMSRLILPSVQLLRVRSSSKAHAGSPAGSLPRHSAHSCNHLGFCAEGAAGKVSPSSTPQHLSSMAC